VGFAGPDSVVKAPSAFPTMSRSMRAQCGVGRGSIIAGGLTVITHRTWSEQAEGRGVSHEETRGGEQYSRSEVQDRGSRSGVKQEPSINPGGVEKVVQDVERGIKVACTDGKSSLGYGAAGNC